MKWNIFTLFTFKQIVFASITNSAKRGELLLDLKNLINMSLFFTETMSGWSQPLMGGPVMHQQMQEPSAFSQHQAMERDDTGIVAPSNTFHQPLPTNFMDFPKVHCRLSLKIYNFGCFVSPIQGGEF